MTAPARRFLLLHGLDNRRPPEHWMWWLGESMREGGEQVLYPQMPSPEQPSLAEWTSLLLAELQQLGRGERIVVAHSLGTALWLRASQSLPHELRASRVLLVSPLGEQAFSPENRNEEFRTRSIDPGLVRAASAERTRAVVSSTGPYAPSDPTAWERALGIDVDRVADAGHITPDDGFGPWPAVLDWCLAGKVPLSVAPAP